MNKCLDCHAIQEAEQDPTTLCDTCGWCEDGIYDEEDFLAGVTCNPDAPEECESCQ